MRDIDESLNCSISLIARFQICLTQNCGFRFYFVNLNVNLYKYIKQCEVIHTLVQLHLYMEWLAQISRANGCGEV